MKPKYNFYNRVRHDACFLFYETVNSTCPETNPYAFNNGERCCTTKNDDEDNPLIFNNTASEGSECTKCPGLRCKDYPIGIQKL